MWNNLRANLAQQATAARDALATAAAQAAATQGARRQSGEMDAASVPGSSSPSPTKPAAAAPGRTLSEQQLRQLVADLKARMGPLQAELKEAREHNVHLQADAQQLKGQLRLAQEQLDAKGGAAADRAMVDANQQLLRRVNELSIQLGTTQQENEQLRHNMERLEALRALQQQQQQEQPGAAASQQVEHLQAELEASRARTLALEQELTGQQYRLEVGAASSQDVAQLKGALEAAQSELASAQAQWEPERSGMATAAAELWNELQQTHSALEEAVDKDMAHMEQQRVRLKAALAKPPPTLLLPAARDAGAGAAADVAAARLGSSATAPAAAHAAASAELVAERTARERAERRVAALTDQLADARAQSASGAGTSAAAAQAEAQAALHQQQLAQLTFDAQAAADEAAARLDGMARELTEAKRQLEQQQQQQQQQQREGGQGRVGIVDAGSSTAAVNSEELAAAQARIAEYEQRLSALSSELQSSQSEVSKCHTRITQLEEAAATAAAASDEQQGRLQEQQVQQLKDELQSALERASAAEQRLMQVGRQLDTEHQRAQAAEQRAAEASTQAAAAHKSLQASQSRVVELDGQLASSRAALEAAEASAAAAEELLSPTGSAAADAARLADEVERLQRALAQAQTRANRAEQRSMELAAEMAVAEKRAANVAERITLLAEMEHKAQALEVRNEELEEQLAEGAEKLASAEADVEAAQLEVEAAQAAADQAQQDYEELRTRLDAFASTKWELEAKLKEVCEREKEASTRIAEYDALKASTARLSAQLRHSQEERDHLARQLKQEQNEHAVAMIALDDLRKAQGRNQKLLQENARLVEQLSKRPSVPEGGDAPDSSTPAERERASAQSTPRGEVMVTPRRASSSDVAEVASEPTPGSIRAIVRALSSENRHAREQHQQQQHPHQQQQLQQHPPHQHVQFVPQPFPMPALHPILRRRTSDTIGNVNTLPSGRATLAHAATTPAALQSAGSGSPHTPKSQYAAHLAQQHSGGVFGTPRGSSNLSNLTNVGVSPLVGSSIEAMNVLEAPGSPGQPSSATRFSQLHTYFSQHAHLRGLVPGAADAAAVAADGVGDGNGEDGDVRMRLFVALEKLMTYSRLADDRLAELVEVKGKLLRAVASGAGVGGMPGTPREGEVWAEASSSALLQPEQSGEVGEGGAAGGRVSAALVMVLQEEAAKLTQRCAALEAELHTAKAAAAAAAAAKAPAADAAHAAAAVAPDGREAAGSAVVGAGAVVEGEAALQLQNGQHLATMAHDLLAAQQQEVAKALALLQVREQGSQQLLDAMQAECSALAAELEGLAAEALAAEQRAEAAETAKVELEHQVAALQQQVKKQQQALQQQTQQQQAHQQQQTQLPPLQREHRASGSAASSAPSSRRASGDGQAAVAAASPRTPAAVDPSVCGAEEVEGLRQRLAAAESALSQAAAARESIGAKLAALAKVGSELGAAKAASEEEAGKLRQQLEVAETGAAALRDRTKALQQQLAEARQLAQAAARAKQELEAKHAAQLAEAEVNLAKATTQLQERTQELADARAAQAVLDGRLASSEQRLAEARAHAERSGGDAAQQLADAQRRADAAEDAAAAARAAAAAAEQRAATLAEELSDAQAAAQAMEQHVQGPAADMAAAHETATHSAAAAAANETKCVSLEQQLEAAQGSADELRQQAAAAAAQAGLAAGQAMAELATVQQRLQEAQTAEAFARVALDCATAEGATAVAALRDVRAELAATEAQAAQLVRARDAAVEQLQEVTRQLGDVRQEAIELAARGADVAQQKGAWDAEQQELQKALAAAQQRMQHKEAEAGKQRARLAVLEAAHAELQQHSVHLIQSLMGFAVGQAAAIRAEGAVQGTAGELLSSYAALVVEAAADTSAAATATSAVATAEGAVSDEGSDGWEGDDSSSEAIAVAAAPAFVLPLPPALPSEASSVALLGWESDWGGLLAQAAELEALLVRTAVAESSGSSAGGSSGGSGGSSGSSSTTVAAARKSSDRFSAQQQSLEAAAAHNIAGLSTATASSDSTPASTATAAPAAASASSSAIDILRRQLERADAALAQQVLELSAAREAERQLQEELGAIRGVMAQQKAAFQGRLRSVEEGAERERVRAAGEVERGRKAASQLQSQLERAAKEMAARAQAAADAEEKASTQAALLRQDVAQLKAQVKALATEKASLEEAGSRSATAHSEEAQRLRRISKKKAEELEELSARYSAAAAKLQEVTASERSLTKELEAERKLVSELQARLQAAEAAAAEAAVLRRDLASAERQLNGAAAELSSLHANVTELSGQRSAAQAEIERLGAEVHTLKSTFGEREALHNEAQSLRARLETATAKAVLADAASEKAAQLQAANELLQVDVTKTNRMIANLEQRLQLVEDDNEGLLSKLEDANIAREAAQRQWEAELDALPTVHREAWPRGVLALVEEVEAKAAAELSSSVSAEVAELQAQLSQDNAQLRTAAEAATRASASATSALADAQAQLAAARQGLADAEAVHAQQLAGLEAAAAAATAHAAAELKQLRGELEGALSAGEAAADVWRDKWEGAQEEMAGLREKVHRMLAEKDASIDSLNAQLRSGASGSGSGGVGGGMGIAQHHSRLGSSSSIGHLAPLHTRTNSAFGGAGSAVGGVSGASTPVTARNAPQVSQAAFVADSPGPGKRRRGDGAESSSSSMPISPPSCPVASPAAGGSINSQQMPLSRSGSLRPPPMSAATAPAGQQAVAPSRDGSMQLTLRAPQAAQPAPGGSGAGVYDSLPLSTMRISGDGGSGPGSPAVGTVSGNARSRQVAVRNAEVEEQLRFYRTAYEDLEHTMALRDQADHAHKEEIARLESLVTITDRDALYVRSVIVSAYESGELPRNGNMFHVLARLLKFTPQETERIERGKGGFGMGGGASGLLLGLRLPGAGSPIGPSRR